MEGDMTDLEKKQYDMLVYMYKKQSKNLRAKVKLSK